MQWSSRALEIHQHRKFERESAADLPFGCQWNDTQGVGWSGEALCHGWGYWGSWSEEEKILLEVVGILGLGKSWQFFLNLSLREVEAYLRDRNARPAFMSENWPNLTQYWPVIQDKIRRQLTFKNTFSPYTFPPSKSFKTLSLPDKIQELKSFFASEKLAGFYRQGGRLEVLDVEDLTVFIGLDCGAVDEASLLDWLQATLAECFRESALNIVHESLSSDDQ